MSPEDRKAWRKGQDQGVVLANLTVAPFGATLLAMTGHWLPASIFAGATVLAAVAWLRGVR